MLFLSANVLAARNAMTAVIFLGLLNGCARQMGRADRRAPPGSPHGEVILSGGSIGGPMAHGGIFFAIAYVGPVFAAIAALMYSIFIALLAQLWYHEKIMARAALGNFLLEISGISIYAPGVLAEVGVLLRAPGWDP
jgi:drug/metabolite transporter (DMT)-like permease